MSDDDRPRVRAFPPEKLAPLLRAIEDPEGNGERGRLGAHIRRTAAKVDGWPERAKPAYLRRLKVGEPCSDPCKDCSHYLCIWPDCER